MKTIVLVLATVACVAGATALPQSSRIVSGNEIIPHTIPYQAHLTVTGTTAIWSCSGSVISHYYILTSARCVDGGVEIAVTLGTHNISFPDPDQITYTSTTQDILTHPEYIADSDLYHNDIALVRTDFEIPFTYHIQPIGLPNTNDLMDSENFVGRTARASGWGLTDSGDVNSQSTVLRYFEGTVLKNSECGLALPSIHDQSMICVSGEGTICGGDVGGPLVADYKLIGISSVWIVDCQPMSFSGYTRVSSYIDWIVENSDIEIA